jgi:predicted permease
MSSYPNRYPAQHIGRSYRLLLKLYPREFRDRYGPDLIALIEDSGAEDSRNSAWLRARTMLNLTANGLGVWLDAISRTARSMLKPSLARSAETGSAGPGDGPRRTFSMRIDSLLQDLRFGLRMLRKHPGLSLIVILTFGLGIGYTSTVFNITNSFVHKELPFEDSGRILALDRTDPERTFQYGEITVPIHDFVEWRAQQSAFEQLAAYWTGSRNLSTGEGQPERHQSGFFTAGVFETLRVQPILGRTIVQGEELAGAEKVIVLGYDLWLNRFGGATDILGRTVFVDAIPRTVIGVMPEGFTFPFAAQFWLPAVIEPTAFERGEGPRYSVLGRLKDGVSADQAEAQMATIAARLAREYPESNEGMGVSVTTLRGRLIPPVHYALFYTMLGATLGVLLIGCANIANLLLARASVRAREVAVRTALGATRSRLVTQLLTEVLVLALVAGGIGMLLGYIGLEWFTAKLMYVLTTAGDGDALPFWIHFEHDYRMALFVVGATVFSSALAGVFPAFQASGANPGEAMKAGSRGSSSLKMGRFTGGLVTAEVAISCVLLILAGLMIKSVRQVSTVDLPFATENVFTARVQLPAQEYPGVVSRMEFLERLFAELEAIPGGVVATLSNGLPGPGYGSTDVRIERQTYVTDEDLPQVHVGWVTPGYFDTFGTGVLQGRAFTAADHSETLPVAVVNESFARVHLAGDAIGRRFRMTHDDAPWLTVVGVVPDMQMDQFGTAGDPAGFYTPMAQEWVGSYAVMAVRTQGPPMEITRDVRRAVASIDPHLPLFRVLPMTGVMFRMTWFYPVFGRLFTIFGFTALFLGAIGLYGVISFAVTQRTREMGIRLALGAQSGTLVGLVMRKGVIQMAIGLGIGLTLALFAAGPLQLVIYEVNGRDPAVFGLVATTLALTCLLASFVPAYRVTRVDPVTALTSE